VQRQRHLYSDAKGANREMGLALRDRKWLLNDGQSQNPSVKLDSGTIPNGLEGFWIRPSFKDFFFCLREGAKP
jgi:hypothetical protein